MAYCTSSDVSDRFPTAATELAASVNGFITLADDEIDSVLRSAGYVTPVTGTVPGMIKEWSILKTGAKLLDVLYERQNSQVDPDYIGDLYRKAREIGEGIRNGSRKLKIALITKNPIVSGNSLTTPRVSQYKLPDGFPLHTPDVNS